MTPNQIVILTMAAALIILLALMAWLMWEPVKQVSTIELEVQEFRRAIRDWENAD